MREYLFRGKSLDTGEWVYGNLIDLDKESGYLYIMRPHLGASTLPPFSLVRLHSELVDPETVSQWTGLVDKNGVKIFEGDVVRYKNTIRFMNHDNLDDYIRDNPNITWSHIDIVKFINGRFSPLPERYDSMDYWYSYAYCDFEVIGNKWDNTELVK